MCSLVCINLKQLTGEEAGPHLWLQPLGLRFHHMAIRTLPTALLMMHSAAWVVRTDIRMQQHVLIRRWILDLL